MEAADAWRLKALDQGNRKLKNLSGGAILDLATLREVFGEDF